MTQVDAISSLSETGEAFTTASFGDTSSYQSSIPFEEQIVRVTTHNNSGDVISSTSVTVEDRHTLMLYGTESTTGHRTALFTDDEGELTSGFSRLRLLHGVAAAAGLDILIDGTPLSSGVGFGASSGYMDVAVGPHTVLVRRTADRSSVFSATLTFEEGRAYTLFAGGEAGYFAFGRFLVDR